MKLLDFAEALLLSSIEWFLVEIESVRSSGHEMEESGDQVVCEERAAGEPGSVLII